MKPVKASQTDNKWRYEQFRNDVRKLLTNDPENYEDKAHKAGHVFNADAASLVLTVVAAAKFRGRVTLYQNDLYPDNPSERRELVKEVLGNESLSRNRIERAAPMLEAVGLLARTNDRRLTVLALHPANTKVKELYDKWFGPGKSDETGEEEPEVTLLSTLEDDLFSTRATISAAPRLSWNDFAAGAFVKSAFAEEVLRRLKGGERVILVLGEQGSGKSTAARYVGVQFLREGMGQHVFTLDTRILLTHADAVWNDCKVIGRHHPDSLVIVDDIHLAPDETDSLFDRVHRGRSTKKLRFVFIGRPTYNGSLRKVTPPLTIAKEDLGEVAKGIVYKYAKKRNIAVRPSELKELLDEARAYFSRISGGTLQHIDAIDLVVLQYLLGAFADQGRISHEGAVEQAQRELDELPARLRKRQDASQIRRAIGCLAAFSQFDISVDPTFLKQEVGISDNVLDTLLQSGDVESDHMGVRLGHATRGLLQSLAMEREPQASQSYRELKSLAGRAHPDLIDLPLPHALWHWYLRSYPQHASACSLFLQGSERGRNYLHGLLRSARTRHVFDDEVLEARTRQLLHLLWRERSLTQMAMFGIINESIEYLGSLGASQPSQLASLEERLSRVVRLHQNADREYTSTEAAFKGWNPWGQGWLDSFKRREEFDSFESERIFVKGPKLEAGRPLIDVLKVAVERTPAERAPTVHSALQFHLACALVEEARRLRSVDRALAQQHLDAALSSAEACSRGAKASGFEFLGTRAQWLSKAINNKHRAPT